MDYYYYYISSYLTLWIIIIIISFMQDIYTYIPETNYVPREYSVAASLLLLFMDCYYYHHHHHHHCVLGNITECCTQNQFLNHCLRNAFY